MSYSFLDAYGSVLTADSSIISGVVQRPIVNIGSTVGVSLSGPLVISSASIVGAYPEDSGHVNADIGVFGLGVRNDAVASFVSANLDYTPHALDSAGRIITKPYAATEALVQGTGSTMGISRSSLLGAPGTGLRNYITDILVANTGSVATLVSFSDSDASIIGKTIAPATSGSNIRLGTPMRTGALNSQVEFIAQTGSSVLHISAFGYKAP